MTIFKEKCFLNSTKCFSAKDLVGYVESVIRSRRLSERYQDRSNYSWLRSRGVANEEGFPDDLDKLMHIIEKLSPENCASIAVKLDSFTENAPNAKAAAILAAFEKILRDQSDKQLVEENLQVMKTRKKKNTFKTNRVQPELMAGRNATVCFVLKEEYF